MWRRWIPLLVALAALALDLRTMVPGVYVSDFAEFQYQPLRLGLPHPNGFPLYMLLGWVLSHLPVENVAWRMNLLSAIGGALAVGVTSAFALRVSRRASVALLAGGLLALLPVFWFYSLAAERYTLNLALLAGAFWAAWEAGAARGGDRDGRPGGERTRMAWLSALLLALGLAMHPSDALLVPFWLFYLILRLRDSRRRPRFWMGLAVAGLAPLLLYAYVPWRWAAFSGWPLVAGVNRSQAVYQGMTHVWFTPGVQWEPVWRYITGLGGYASGLVSGGWLEAFRLLPQTGPDWTANISWWLLIPAALGGLWLARRDWALVVALAGFALLDSLMVAYIGQGKNQAYLLPAFWVVLFFTAFALDAVLMGMERTQCGGVARGTGHTGPAARAAHETGGAQRTAPMAAGAHHGDPPGGRFSGADSMPLRRRLPDAVAAALVAILLLTLLAREYGARDLSREVETDHWWQTILAHPIEPNAALLGQWSDMTPLWYAQQIDGSRPDLLGLFPPDTEQVIEPWLATGSALYLAAPLREWAPDLQQRFDLVPWGKLVRILPRGEAAPCPPQANSVDVDPSWPFSVTSWEIDRPLTGGQQAALRFCWEARANLPKDTFLTLELQAGDGEAPIRVVEPLMSTWYPAESVPPGTVGLAVIPVRLPVGSTPGDYNASLVPYRLHEEGDVEQWPGVEPVSLGQVAVQAGSGFRRSLLTREVAPLVSPRAGPLVLRAWWLSGEPVRPGDPVQLDLLWEVAEVPIAPVSVSVDLRGGLSVVSLPRRPMDPGAASEWVPGMLLRSTYSFRAPRGSGDRTYLVEPRLWAGEAPAAWSLIPRLPVGTLRVKDRPHVDQLPEGITTAGATFGDIARLEGYTIEGSGGEPGGVLPVTLYWRAGAETSDSYWVFLHLVDSSGRIVAQHDSPPAGGALPTEIWVTGEVIADRHEVALPPDLPAGDYTLQVGLYRLDTFERLPVASSLPSAGDALDLTPVAIKP
jgi:hypothetical protein